MEHLIRRWRRLSVWLPAGFVAAAATLAAGLSRYLPNVGVVLLDPARRGGGQGLRNMRERLEALGGRLEVRSANSRGTELSGEVPFYVEVAL